MLSKFLADNLCFSTILICWIDSECGEIACEQFVSDFTSGLPWSHPSSERTKSEVFWLSILNVSSAMLPILEYELAALWAAVILHPSLSNKRSTKPHCRINNPAQRICHRSLLIWNRLGKYSSSYAVLWCETSGNTSLRRKEQLGSWKNISLRVWKYFIIFLLIASTYGSLV